ncbi:MAG TPA: nucleotidyltransferase family protein [Bryobacteraceae bacterium]|nr:nucleotidyltransferase family protein [Bryobacteraceae bacterium]
MKALILAGGRGKRLEAHSADRNKCMLEFGGKPLIERSLENGLRIEPKEIVIVVGYQAEQIINCYGNSYRGVAIKYAIQKEQRGLVNAIQTAVPFLGASDFMLLLADEILLAPDHIGMLSEYRASGAFALCGVTTPRDRDAVKKTYAILEDQHGRILRLIEKPRKPVNEFQGTGNIILSNRILEYIDWTPINQVRNEKELPDLIQCAIDDGHVVKSFLVGGQYINVNTPEDLENAGRELAWVA